MSKSKKPTPLSADALLANGWTQTGEHDIIARKKIENRNPLNASEDSDIELVVHGMYNSQTFALLLPDGGMLNFVVNNMKELQAFEKAIDFYDPPF